MSDLEIKEILSEIEEDLSFNINEKDILEKQCMEFINKQIKEMNEEKHKLIYKKINNILDNVGLKIAKQFKLDNKKVSKIINNEMICIKNEPLIKENENEEETHNSENVNEESSKESLEVSDNEQKEVLCDNKCIANIKGKRCGRDKKPGKQYCGYHRNYGKNN